MFLVEVVDVMVGAAMAAGEESMVGAAEVDLEMVGAELAPEEPVGTLEVEVVCQVRRVGAQGGCTVVEALEKEEVKGMVAAEAAAEVTVAVMLEVMVGWKAAAARVEA